MKISIQNYEAFVLDFLEGNLSEQKQAEMLLFLEQNPHLQTEIDDLLDENLVLTADETIVFEDKSILKKQEGKKMPIIIAFYRKTTPLVLLAAAVFAIFAMNKNMWNNSLNIQNTKPVISQQTNFKIDTTAVEDTLCNIVNSDLYLAENQAVIESKNIEKNIENNSQNRIEKSKNLKLEKSIPSNFATANSTKKASLKQQDHVVEIENIAKSQAQEYFEKPIEKSIVTDFLTTSKTMKKVSVSLVEQLPSRNVAQIEMTTVSTTFSEIKTAVAVVEATNAKSQTEKTQGIKFSELDAEEITSSLVSKILPTQKQFKSNDFSLLSDLKSAFVPQAYSNDTEQKTTAIQVSFPVESKHLRFIQKVWNKQENQ